MEALAQLVERWFVVPNVTGSSPVCLPKRKINTGENMCKYMKKKVQNLKLSGMIENKDFRIVYFSNQAEIKFL